MKLSWPKRVTYIQQPDVRPYSKGKYRLHEAWPFMMTDNFRTYSITVPEGLIIDGASVGRLLWSVSGLRPDGLVRAAALAHDWCYRCKGEIPCTRSIHLELKEAVKISREEADRLFLDLMLAAGMVKWRANMAHRAVRMFGPRW